MHSIHIYFKGKVKLPIGCRKFLVDPDRVYRRFNKNDEGRMLST